MRRLISELHNDPELTLQLVVTGTHLEDAFGMTRNEIVADGFPIDCEVPIDLSDDSRLGVSRSTALGLEGIAKAFDQLQPDLVLLLGDRYEAFAAATAALFMNLPVAHLHGGEKTEGAMDEALRHAITKMSHLHFPSTEDYRQRILQLGEDPAQVYCVGAPGVENVLKTELMAREDLEAELGFAFGDRLMMVTFHPVTLENNTSKEQFQNLLDALDRFGDSQIIITKANADMGGHIINQMIDDYGAKHPGRVAAYASMGLVRYLSAMKCAKVVVGNSSSGIIETPSFGMPTVNIGARQKGRTRADTVIDCKPTTDDITQAIRKALSDEVQAEAATCENPYAKPDTAKTVKDIVKAADLSSVLKKSFHDLRAQ